MAVVQAKLDRARHHAAQFTEKWSQFASTNIHTYEIDQDTPYAVHFRWTYQPYSPETQRALTELSLIYADFLGNLRATLDYLAWQLVLAAGNTPRRATGFPAAKNGEQFKALRGQKLIGIKGRWVEVIESLQPYHTE